MHVWHQNTHHHFIIFYAYSINSTCASSQHQWRIDPFRRHVSLVKRIVICFHCRSRTVRMMQLSQPFISTNLQKSAWVYSLEHLPWTDLVSCLRISAIVLSKNCGCVLWRKTWIFWIWAIWTPKKPARQLSTSGSNSWCFSCSISTLMCY